jgi:hypothetical protein
MLVDNKFFYISIPRTSSKSFHISCFKNDIDIKHVDARYDNINQLQYIPDFNLIKDTYTLSTHLRHGHETISQLEERFGNNFEIISVRRNKYERFISSWNHMIVHIERLKVDGYKEIIKILSELDENEIFDFNNEILNIENLRLPDSNYSISNFFLNKFNIKILTNKEHFLHKALWWQYTPTSYYHQNHNKIIWFDFEKLYELEDWVSNKLNMDFKLEKINSSKHIKSNLKVTDNFIKKYDNIYNKFDTIKTNKSIL